MSSLSRIRTP